MDDTASPPGAGTLQPRIIATVSDHASLVEAFRVRAREQGITLSSDTNHSIAGLAARYIPKLIGSNPIRNIGAASLGPLCGLFCVRLVMVEDAEAQKRLEMLAERYGKSVETRVDFQVRDRAWHMVKTWRFLQKIGRKGGLARAAKMSPTQRRRSARKAAFARWHKPKIEGLGAVNGNTDKPPTLDSTLDEAAILTLTQGPRRKRVVGLPSRTSASTAD